MLSFFLGFLCLVLLTILLGSLHDLKEVTQERDELWDDRLKEGLYNSFTVKNKDKASHDS